MGDRKLAVPVHILTGFLGSGKTTLLTRALDHALSEGLRPAVIMNELGDVNLDGELLDRSVPSAEMLGGCICCTIRGDLGLEIKGLLERESPDVLFIEATGAANPLEIIDGVTEASLYMRVELRSVVAVVDGPALLLLSGRGGAKGATFRLMREQIRCASRLVLNKTDKLEPEELVQVQSLVREWNPQAPLEAVVRGMADLSMFDDDARYGRQGLAEDKQVHSSACGPGCGHEAHTHLHETHAHVMALTYYFRGAVDSLAFEALLHRLPDNVYRAKGIVAFTDTASKRFLFQYAFRETDFIGIDPQGDVENVAVFIGEHFEREPLLRELEALESKEQGEG